MSLQPPPPAVPSGPPPASGSPLPSELPLGPIAATTAVVVSVLRSIGAWSIGLSGLLAVGEATGMVELGESIWQAPLLFLVVAVAHELGHLIAIVALGGKIEAVGTVGQVAVGITHYSLGRTADVICVCGGPVLAAVVGSSIAVAAWPSANAFLVAMIGLGHLISLVVPVGDGAQLRRLLRPPAALPPRS